MQRKSCLKMNNKGFTLLEVLVAVVILAVVSVPLLRSFATAAQTNRKSKIEEKCTTAAENLAESFRDVPVEDLVERYEDLDGTTIDYEEISGEAHNGEVYTFHIEDQDAIGSSMPDGYYAEVVLDSRYYENANGLNLAELNSVSKDYYAIYTMNATGHDETSTTYTDGCAPDKLPSTLASYKCAEDAVAYAYFYDLNKKSGSSYALLGDTPQAAWDNLRRMLRREIQFDVKKVGEHEVEPEGGTPEEEPLPGEPTPEAGEKIDLVNVTMTIKYIMTGHDGEFFAKEKNEYVVKSSSLFDNTLDYDEFEGVYLFYYPRYLAGIQAGKELDKVILNNPDNIEMNFCVTALEGADNSEYKATYLAGNGLCVDVIENNPDVSTRDASVKFYTNMNGGAPYSKDDSRDGVGDLKVTLKYKANTNDTKLSGGQAADYLHASNIDGKVLNKNETSKRIYKMTVNIYDGTFKSVPGVTDPVPNVVVSFDGTKLEY